MGPVNREDAIGDFSRLQDRLRRDRGNVDRYVVSRSIIVQSKSSRHPENLAVILQTFACNEHVDDFRVLSQTPEGQFKTNSMKILDNAMTRGT